MCLNQEHQNVVIYGENIFIIVLWLSPIFVSVCIRMVSYLNISVYLWYMILSWVFLFDVCSRCRIVSEWYTFGIFPVYCTILSEFYVFFCVFFTRNQTEPTDQFSLVQFGQVRVSSGRVGRAFHFYSYFMIIVMSNYIYILLHY